MRVGQIKARLFRVFQYATLIAAPSAILTVVKVYGYRWWVALFALPLIVLAYFLDAKVLKGEQAYFNENNEQWQKVLRDIEWIKQKLEQQ